MTFTIKNEFLLIALLGALLLALIAASAQGLPVPLQLLRLLLGLFFVLFAPGYALQAALFPRNRGIGEPLAAGLDGPERVALSFGLSLGVVAPMALVLDSLPWGIRLLPIAGVEGLFVAVCAVIALYRRSRLPVVARPALTLGADVRGSWQSQDRAGRVLSGVAILAVLTMTASAIAILAADRPGERFTEFYMLGADGLAESYPREARVGEEIGVTLGVRNHERGPRTYRVEMWVTDPGNGGQRERVAQDGPYTLEVGSAREWPVSWTMPWAGDNQVVELLLFDGDGTEPYRSLRLWLNVAE